MTLEEVFKEVEEISGIDFQNNPEHFFTYIKVILRKGNNLYDEVKDLEKENQELLLEISDLQRQLNGYI